MMNNKVVNKQIPIKSIIDVANYLEDYKERYEKLFKEDEEKNKGKAFREKNYEYGNSNTKLKYTIEFHNGKSLTESDYYWFIEKLNQPRTIKRIELLMSISYSTKSQGSDYNDMYNHIYATVEFRDRTNISRYSDTIINIDATYQEREANNIYSTIMNILEDNEDRYNKTIKNRKIRMQSFCISVGIVLSYILYFALKINIDKLNPFIVQYVEKKIVLLFGQWFVAILLGNVFSYWYILSVYRPLLPESKYAGYNRSTYKSIYKDDIDDYLEHSEVHFGRFWDAENRRNKIEKIYKITSKIVLVQLLISIVLFFILK